MVIAHLGTWIATAGSHEIDRGCPATGTLLETLYPIGVLLAGEELTPVLLVRKGQEIPSISIVNALIDVAVATLSAEVVVACKEG